MGRAECPVEDCTQISVTSMSEPLVIDTPFLERVALLSETARRGATPALEPAELAFICDVLLALIDQFGAQLAISLLPPPSSSP